MSNASPLPGVSQEQFAALLAQFMAEKLGATAAPKPTYRELWVKFSLYGSSITDGGRPRLRSWPAYVTGSKRHLPFFGDKPWDEINLLACEEYRAHCRTLVSGKTRRPLKGATINKDLRQVQACLTYAFKRGLIPRQPLQDLEDEPVQHDRDFAITEEQFLALLKHARPLLRHMLVLFYETGCRRDELRTLEWTEVDLNGGFIKILARKCKTANDRDIPLTPTAMMVLDMIPRDPSNPYVFATPYGPTGPVSKSTLADWFVDARNAAGVTGPKGQPVWLHTLRHTYATDASSRGVPLETLMAICGWTNERTMRRYINLAQRHKREAAQVMAKRSEMLAGMLDRQGRAPARPSRIVTAVAAEVAAAPVATAEATG